jgi:hypothetical protein
VVAIVPGSLVYVSCVVHFALRPSIYICSKLVFPMGGFSRVMLTKNMCEFHACLEVQINILKLKYLEVVLFVLMYIACANIEKRKHLQGHLKRTLNHQNIELKVGDSLLS